jgi:antitoxin (DNA-binding transcriptional repressor) of toxin-antitoxin stability system
VKKVTTHEAKTHLSRLIAEVRAGEEVLIYRGDQPTARLVRVGAEQQATAPRRPAVGTVTSAPVLLSADAFEPLTEEELAGWGL